jgi:hypothetical protein
MHYTENQITCTAQRTTIDLDFQKVRKFSIGFYPLPTEKEYIND